LREFASVATNWAWVAPCHNAWPRHSRVCHPTPGSSLFEPNFYDPALDWHWTPPAGEAYSFDLQKAGAALTASTRMPAAGTHAVPHCVAGSKL